MRNMSFALTTQQIRDRKKTVTRRLGWAHLKPGDLVMACEKCMGFKKGETIQRLSIVIVISNRPEPLNLMVTDGEYGDHEAVKEGFPEMTGSQFVGMFSKNMSCQKSKVINRIEYRYIPGGSL